MRVVTVATKSDGYFPYLLASCERYGIKLDVLGWNTEWQGFNHRLHMLRDYLNTLPDNEVVMFIDAYDVVFTRPLEDLEVQYRQRAGDRVAIAVEEMSALGATAYNYVVFGRCTGKALNAGTYMGYVHLLKAMLSLVKSERKHGDDQRAITDLCKKQTDVFYLDEASDWFLVSGGDRTVDDDITFRDGELWYHGRRPFVLHCPGNRDMTPYLRALGYPAPVEEQRRPSYHVRVLSHQARQLLERTWDSLLGRATLFVVGLLMVRTILRRIRRSRVPLLDQL